MKNYFKKFSVMFVMALILMLGFSVTAFATDDGVIGTSNLNNTTSNSAVVGEQLTAPEIGWKRYDDTDNNIKYNGKWSKSTTSIAYNSSLQYTSIYGNTIQFKFYGTKFRLIDTRFPDRDPNPIISVDGSAIADTNNFKGNIQYQTLVLQKTGLSLGFHTVSITKDINDSSSICLDAIDIDYNGYLIDPNESIALDKSTMDLAEGGLGQLTATTTPSAIGITWTTSDPSIATVDSTGKVTGMKEGTCTITATTADGLTATCVVTVTKKDDPQPTEPTGDANLFIELVDGQIKQYTVSQDEINKFTSWFENRDKDHSLTATYKFTKGTYKDYVVHDQIDWFEVR